ncbi:hypothetical protein MEG1DRAFT_00863 [Photorhabdus temperata subsp. temperata Meg1]|uniref:Uncharacterized protein n=1 Tax=Photorhabdus temperata subsp. temperata Meg1 TaxID=1393735 RepID=A0A081S066_PHOTE|nr:hypothetical protein MEG1DRAFT_00863 [Photorhabdus temperata subsp. temperata Meg1]
MNDNMNKQVEITYKKPNNLLENFIIMIQLT